MAEKSSNETSRIRICTSSFIIHSYIKILPYMKINKNTTTKRKKTKKITEKITSFNIHIANVILHAKI